MTLAAGSRLGPHEILGPIGAGGMGEVHKARDPRPGQGVAIEVLPAPGDLFVGIDSFNHVTYSDLFVVTGWK